MQTAPVQQKSETTDFLPLHGTDFVEFYVGNAKQAAHYYQSAFGFQPLAYSGPETGNRETCSYALRQNKLTFVFTSALKKDHPVARSEEHTSELQSRENILCRLLLEKKKY